MNLKASTIEHLYILQQLISQRLQIIVFFKVEVNDACLIKSIKGRYDIIVEQFELMQSALCLQVCKVRVTVELCDDLRRSFFQGLFKIESIWALILNHRKLLAFCKCLVTC